MYIDLVFSKFIYSLGIKDVGESSSRSLASTFHNMNELMDINMAKLKDRYPTGFDKGRSNARYIVE